MVKLICMLKRKAGLSPEEFHRYWREVHGPLVASTRSGQHAARYEQNHRSEADYGRPGGGDYDGCTEQWFASIEDFYASIQEDDYVRIAADIETFIDTSSLVWIMTEEPEVVFG